jgi:CRP/FNR family transcriptional regulator, cyclic AMP receptor protein
VTPTISPTSDPHSDEEQFWPRAVTFLPGVDDRTAGALLQFTQTVVVKGGETVFTEGEVDEAVYLVTAGKVKLSRWTRSGSGSGSGSGSETVLAVLGPGQVIGEPSFLHDGTRSATARAITDATLEELPSDRLRELMCERTEVSHWILRQLARRLRQASDLAVDLVLLDVQARVARILTNLAEQFGFEASDGVLVEHGLSQLELAQFAGATRESVNKAMGAFADRNWVTIESGSVLIRDLDALRRRTALREGSGATRTPSTTT